MTLLQWIQIRFTFLVLPFWCWLTWCCCVSSQSYGDCFLGLLGYLYWLTLLSMAAPSRELTTLIWSHKFGQHWRRRDEESCIIECYFTRTMHLLGHHLKHWLRLNCWIHLLYHPPYSPDLAPSDYYLSSEKEEFTEGCKFAGDEDVICMANSCLEEWDQQFFYYRIWALEGLWTKCISVAGEKVTKYDVHILLLTLSV